MVKGIFVTHRGSLEGSRGGVQICTQEYVDVINAAGIELRICTLERDRRYSTRVFRRLNSSPYFRVAEPAAIHAIAQCVVESRPDFVFLNQVGVATLGPEIKQVAPSTCKIVVLSHGLESTDLFHFIRLRRQLPLSGLVRPSPESALGHALLVENALRTHVDIVCTLSPFDAELERWVGASNVGWLPRIVRLAPLEWKPLGERLGFVGTLDHAPNLEGLVEILKRLASHNVGRLRVRIIGGPAKTAKWLEDNYPFVDCLGSVDQKTVAKEASTWNAFLHPIFCHPRGCSTKLAAAIAWQIPIITTTMGQRGYMWRAGELVVADDPSIYVDECFRLLDNKAAAVARIGVGEIARSSPSLEDNASRLRGILGL